MADNSAHNQVDRKEGPPSNLFHDSENNLFLDEKLLLKATEALHYQTSESDCCRNLSGYMAIYRFEDYATIL